jgi:hypothetical protein
MIRLNVLAEGPTEETFINQILNEHLSTFNILVTVQCVETKRKGPKGGMTSYSIMMGHLERWIKSDRKPDAFFTTMFDLYALPDDFPMSVEAKGKKPYQRIDLLESAFAEDVKRQFPNASRKFIPYIQLFEFEALLFSDPTKFVFRFSEYETNIARLVQVCSAFESPELINDNRETAPSKRIIKEIPAYKYAKPSAGPLIAQQIGLPTMRLKCPHFDSWVTKLEGLQFP